MPTNEEDALAVQNKGIDIIRALASGEISLKDAHAKLKHDTVDTLELLLAIVAQAQKAAASPVSARLGAQIQNFSRATPPEVIKRIVHKVPFLPVMINGTLYDPGDIKRFDGVELHFLPASDHLIAINDRAVIARWWETSYLSSLLNTRTFESRENNKTGLRDFPPFPPMDPDVPGPSTPYAPGGGNPDTTFFEHANYEGDALYLRRDRGYADLTKVGRGFLGFGDWNDVISSVRLGNVRIAVLYEHINYGGSTLSSRDAYPLSNLAAFGWNDRASSVGTW